jgi:hypothetical protein
MDHVSSDGPVDARHYGSFGGDVEQQAYCSGGVLYLIPLITM